MLKVMLSTEAGHALRSILKNEEKNACIRLREFRSGSGWGDNYSVRFGLGIDSWDESDLRVEVASLVFIMDPALANRYGTSFAVSLDARNAPRLISARLK